MSKIFSKKIRIKLKISTRKIRKLTKHYSRNRNLRVQLKWPKKAKIKQQTSLKNKVNQFNKCNSSSSLNNKLSNQNHRNNSSNKLNKKLPSNSAQPQEQNKF